MIARCPICSSRHDIPSDGPSGGGMLVDCASCGHSWVEGTGTTIAPSLRPEATPVLETAAKQSALHPLIEAARRSQVAFRLQRRARRLRFACWGAVVAMALAPLAAAAVFPERVVAVLPATIALYEKMGRDVNIYGLEIRQVDLQHLVVDGHQVIAVKGELANISDTERKVPWLRFGLRSNDNAEVYHWLLDSDARPLKPGESTSFVTRLASPPEAARNLEIRFARFDEIGSNAKP